MPQQIESGIEFIGGSFFLVVVMTSVTERLRAADTGTVLMVQVTKTSGFVLNLLSGVATEVVPVLSEKIVGVQVTCDIAELDS